MNRPLFISSALSLQQQQQKNKTKQNKYITPIMVVCMVLTLPSSTSKPRLSNLIVFNSKVTHGRSQTTKYGIHTKYRSLLGKVKKNSENNITAI